jgi:hypothetical protein
VVVSAEPGPVYRDLFGSDEITEHSGGAAGSAAVRLIRPDSSLGELGVDFATASDAGLDKAYSQGWAAGVRYLDTYGWDRSTP